MRKIAIVPFCLFVFAAPRWLSRVFRFTWFRPFRQTVGGRARCHCLRWLRTGSINPTSERSNATATWEAENSAGAFEKLGDDAAAEVEKRFIAAGHQR